MTMSPPENERPSRAPLQLSTVTRQPFHRASLLSKGPVEYPRRCTLFVLLATAAALVWITLS